MAAVLNAAFTPFAAVSLPLAATILIAATAIVAIGVAVRRLRAHGKLTFAHATTGAAVASFVLAAALLVSASIVPPTHAAATPSKSQSGVSPATMYNFTPVPIDDLEGYQLPTK